MAVSWALAVVMMLTALAEECPTHHNGNAYVCKGDEACIRWRVEYREDAASKILVFHPDGIYIVTQNWTGAQEIFDRRASLKWIKDSAGDLIDFKLKNTTLKDDGVYLKMLCFDDEYATERKRLHVLESCPVLDMYSQPRVSYKTRTSNATDIRHILELTEPGNVTLRVSIPAADPPVRATIVSGKSHHSCNGSVDRHAECEALLQFDTSGEQHVTVTFTFVAWASVTRHVYVLTKDHTNIIPHWPTQVFPQLDTDSKAQDEKSAGMIIGLGVTAAFFFILAITLAVVIFVRAKKQHGKAAAL